MYTDFTGLSSSRSRKAAKSSSEYFVGRQARGLWLKICIDSAPMRLCTFEGAHEPARGRDMGAD